MGSGTIEATEMPLDIRRSDIDEVGRRVSAAIARQCHHEYHEPVWGDGRSRLAAQQATFEIEDFLRRHHITVVESTK